MAIVAHFGEVQTLVLLGLVYTFAIGPTALLTSMVGRDFLEKRKLRKPGTAWRKADSRPAELENVKQPF